jgi:chromosome partitioning protein
MEIQSPTPEDVYPPASSASESAPAPVEEKTIPPPETAPAPVPEEALEAPKPDLPPEKNVRVVAVANQKGGVGKTTTIVTLAACLAEKKQRVLVIDLDPQANATSGLGLPVQEGRSLYPVLLGQGSAASLIKETAIPGLDTITSELDLAGSEVEIARMDGYLHCLQRALEPLISGKRYDVILIDCPPSLGILTMNALAAADSVLVPMQCEYYALEGLSVVTDLVSRLRESGANPRLRLEGILMTMFDGRTNLAAQVVEEVRGHFGQLVYTTVIPRNVRVSEAPSHGLPVTLYDSRCLGAAAYRALCEEFMGQRKS